MNGKIKWLPDGVDELIYAWLGLAVLIKQQGMLLDRIRATVGSKHVELCHIVRDTPCGNAVDYV